MVAVAELWNTILYPGNYGTLNSLLGHLGFGAQPFLSDPDLLTGVGDADPDLEERPYDMVIFVAGLAGIDKQLYEAAAIDGAGAWHRLRHVTLPSLRPVTTHRHHPRRHPRPAGLHRDLRPDRRRPGRLHRDHRHLHLQTRHPEQPVGMASAVSTVLFLVTVLLTCLTLWWRGRREA